jgi:hypothetical protein
MQFPISAQDRDFRRIKGVKRSKDRKLPKEAVKSRAAEKAKARRKQAKATYNGPRTAYVPDHDTIDAEIAEHEFYAGMCCTGHDIYDLREEHIFLYGEDAQSYMGKPMFSDETKERRAMAKLYRLRYKQQFS